ncbi:MAG TPA: DUF192 domain-containing protein [Nitrospirota bacterium]|nr:DUF192 domain-containing protein [Nitrospirota bacterium]
MIAAFIILLFAVLLRRTPRIKVDGTTGKLVALLATAVVTLTPAVGADKAYGTEQGAYVAGGLSGDRPVRQLTVTAIPRGKSGGGRTFSVVLVCDTSRMRSKGLQGFRPLKPEEAALFVFDRPEAVTFWMGSVTFPIDIIFVSSEHAVVSVYAGCRPGSRDHYPSTASVKWVIETAAGSGIAVGDRVRIE